jgi:hypothetical protein
MLNTNVIIDDPDIKRHALKALEAKNPFILNFRTKKKKSDQPTYPQPGA